MKAYMYIFSIAFVMLLGLNSAPTFAQQRNALSFQAGYLMFNTQRNQDNFYEKKPRSNGFFVQTGYHIYLGQIRRHSMRFNVSYQYLAHHLQREKPGLLYDLMRREHLFSGEMLFSYGMGRWPLNAYIGPAFNFYRFGTNDYYIYENHQTVYEDHHNTVKDFISPASFFVIGMEYKYRNFTAGIRYAGGRHMNYTVLQIGYILPFGS